MADGHGMIVSGKRESRTLVAAMGAGGFRLARSRCLLRSHW